MYQIDLYFCRENSQGGTFFAVYSQVMHQATQTHRKKNRRKVGIGFEQDRVASFDVLIVHVLAISTVLF